MPSDFEEFGTSGLKRHSGYVFEEFLPHLQGSRALQVYSEMRDNDPIIGGMLLGIELLLRRAAFDVRPSDEESTEATEVAEFVHSCFDDMSTSFEDVTSDITSMFAFGWAANEIVYKRRNGPQEEPGESSQHDDGRIGWRKLPLRAQETLHKWEFDEAGGVNGLWQIDLSNSSRPVFIPIEKLLLFRTTQRKGNPEGKSILRNAYRPWFFKKRMEEIEAVGVERDLAGMPVISAPSELFSAHATSEQKHMLNKLHSTVRDVRRDETDGLVFPLDYDEDGNERYRFELLGTGGRRQLDTDTIIRRYDQRIAISTLQDWILLGHERVGTQALAQEKTEMFTTSAQSWLDSISSVFNRHGIPRLMKLNDIDPELTPKLTYEPIDKMKTNEIIDALETLAKSGMPLFPDADLQGHLREELGLPPAEEEEQELMTRGAAAPEDEDEEV